MARYKAKADCLFQGRFYQAGDEFTGPALEGYALETATYLEILEDAPEKPAKPGKKGKAGKAQKDA